MFSEGEVENQHILHSKLIIFSFSGFNNMIWHQSLGKHSSPPFYPRAVTGWLL